MLSICLVVMYSCSSKKEEKKEVQAVNQLINLTITTPEAKQISLHDVDGKNIFIFFNAECDHCQREATAISENMEAFSGYMLYFISADGPAEQIKFAKDYGLEGKSNVIFGRTEPMFIYQTVGSIDTPSLYIYNDQRQLTKQFNGETPIQEIIQAL